jgi:HAD superfamily hydrolase (TIGR01509 family)
VCWGGDLVSPLAIAWDIDGTLIDSEPLHHRALLAVCRNWGVDLSDLPEKTFRGVHMEEVWARLRERMPLEAGMQVWLDSISTYYLDNRDQLRPMPNALETVTALASKGLRQVCVSNSSRPIVDANLRAMNIGNFIEFSISLDDVQRGKPDPCPYSFSCGKLGLQPSSVIAVEDTLAGIRSADAAGLIVLEYAQSGSGSDLAIARISDLIQVLEHVA